MNVILYILDLFFLLHRAGGLSQISVVCKKKWWKRNWETFAWLKWLVEIWPLPLSHTSKLQVGKITSKNIYRGIGCYVELNFFVNLFNLQVVERSLTDKNQMKHFILMCNEHRHKQHTVRTAEIVDPTIRFIMHIAYCRRYYLWLDNPWPWHVLVASGVTARVRLCQCFSLWPWHCQLWWLWPGGGYHKVQEWCGVIGGEWTRGNLRLWPKTRGLCASWDIWGKDPYIHVAW